MPLFNLLQHLPRQKYNRRIAYLRRPYPIYSLLIGKNRVLPKYGPFSQPVNFHLPIALPRQENDHRATENHVDAGGDYPRRHD